MLPKFTGPYFVKINFYTHTANTIHEIARYILIIISVFYEKIGGHRCFFSAMGNKMGEDFPSLNFFQY
jgi:hypothetical protein